MSVSVAEQVDLLKKQASLVARLANVASTQQRVLAQTTAAHQDYDAAAPTRIRTAAPDSDNEADVNLLEDDTYTAAAAVRKVDAHYSTEEESAPNTIWEPNALSDLKDFEKTWAAHVVPPTDWSWEESRDRDDSPKVAPVLEHVYGYRTRGCRNNIALVDDDTVVYHVAGVAVVESISNNRQRFFREHDDDIVCLHYNPLRRIVATGQIGLHARICVWRVDEPAAEPLLEVPFGVGVAACAISSDGTRLVGVGLDAERTIIVADIATGKQIAVRSAGHSRVISVAWVQESSIEPNSHIVTVGDKHVSFWRVPTGDGSSGSDGANNTLAAVPPLFGRLGELQSFTCVASTVDATYVGCEEGAVYVFSSNKLVRSLTVHDGPIYSITPRVTTAELLTGGRDGFANILEEGTLRRTATFDLNSADKCHGLNSVKAIAVSARDDGSSTFAFIVGTVSGSIYKFAGAAYKQTTIVTSHFADPSALGRRGEVRGLAAHPTQLTVASAGEDGTLRLWDLSRHRQTHRADFRHFVTCLCYTPDGARLVAGFANGAVAILNSRNLISLHSLTKTSRRVECVRVSPDGSSIAAGYADGFVRIFAVEGDTLTLTSAFRPLQDTTADGGVGCGIVHMDWSLDASALRINSKGADLCTIDVKSGDLVDAVASRDVKFATQTCVLGWNVQGIWPLHSKGSEVSRVVRTREGLTNGKGPWLATAEASGAIRLFNYPCVGSGVNPRTKQLARRPHGVQLFAHSAHAANADFSFDASFLVSTGGSDGCVMQWSLPQTQ